MREPLFFLCRPWRVSDGLPMTPIVSALYDPHTEEEAKAREAKRLASLRVGRKG